MTLECSCGSELAELMTYHILCDINRHMLASVMDCDRVTYEIGEYCAGAAPCLENLLLVSLVHSENALVEGFLDIRAFLYASAHDYYFLSSFAAS